jgi:hypothetical protein
MTIEVLVLKPSSFTGVLEKSSDIIASLLNATSRKAHDAFFEDGPFPPTPPLSEISQSRPRSPESTVEDMDLSVTTLRVPGRITSKTLLR